MSFQMFLQVIAPHESLWTFGAAETLFTSVRPPVPLQLIRASKALAAEDPVANKRPFTSVPAQVGSQVRGLAINLATIWKMANMLLLPQSAIAILSRIHAADAVWTSARDPSEPASRLGRLTSGGKRWESNCCDPVRTLVVHTRLCPTVRRHRRERKVRRCGGVMKAGPAVRAVHGRRRERCLLLLLHLHVRRGGGLNLGGHRRCLSVSSRSTGMRVLECPARSWDRGQSGIGRGKGITGFLRNNIKALYLVLAPR